MSPRSLAGPAAASAIATVNRFWIGLGGSIRTARLTRRWTVDELARRAGLSRWTVYLIERGHPTSVEAVARTADALGLRLEADITDPRKRQIATARLADPVHSAMGELEAGHFRQLGYPSALDEPYQHYQFAGRADFVTWDLEQRALLHIENRTRFPDMQEMAGSYNAKRAYLGRVLADRLGVSQWRSETHVIAALWTAEVLHALRLRTESFRALCPDALDALDKWWSGDPPPSGRTSTFVILDPLATGRTRRYVGLDPALQVRPRHRGYAEVASAMMGRSG